MEKIPIFSLYLLIYKKRAVFGLLVILLGAFLVPWHLYAVDITDESIIELTNRERADQGLLPLTANQLLAKAAYAKGQAIISDQLFAHDLDGKRFSAWIKDAGYAYSYVGENLAMDFKTAEGTVNAWMDSPTHRKNLLNPVFREIGIAVISGNYRDHDTILVVQIFGAPQTAPAIAQAGQAGFPEPLSDRVREPISAAEPAIGSPALSGTKWLTAENENWLWHAAASASNTRQAIMVSSQNRPNDNYPGLRQKLNHLSLALSGNNLVRAIFSAAEAFFGKAAEPDGLILWFMLLLALSALQIGKKSFDLSKQF